MSRRPRMDSKDEMVRIFNGANKEILPPEHVPLDETDMPFFRNVIAEFAKAEWTAHQIEMAAMLARSMRDMESEQRKLREEGSVAYSEKGTPVVNPRKTVVQMLSGTILSMRRSLALNARAQSPNLSGKDTAKRRDMAKQHEAMALDSGEDDLIARPN